MVEVRQLTKSRETVFQYWPFPSLKCWIQNLLLASQWAWPLGTLTTTNCTYQLTTSTSKKRFSMKKMFHLWWTFSSASSSTSSTFLSFTSMSKLAQVHQRTFLTRKVKTLMVLATRLQQWRLNDGTISDVLTTLSIVTFFQRSLCSDALITFSIVTFL